MLSTRRIGTRGAASRLVHKSSASASATSSSSQQSSKCSAGILSSYLVPTPPSAVAHQHHQGQQVRTNYSSLIDPGSAHSKGPGVGGRAQPWQPEENIDIQKVTQTAIVSPFAILQFFVCIFGTLHFLWVLGSAFLSEHSLHVHCMH